MASRLNHLAALKRQFDRRHRKHTVVVLLLLVAALLAGFDLALVAILHDWLPPDTKAFAERAHGPLTAWLGFIGTVAAILEAHRSPPPDEAP